MQIFTALNIFFTILGLCLFAWRRQWIMSLVFTFLAAYTIFDKVLPLLLPEALVLSLALISLVLVAYQLFQQFTHRNKGDLQN